MQVCEVRKKVIIVGGGFAGIEAAKYLGRNAPNVDVIVIDRLSYTTFQPLLYQVALGVLSPSDITRPVRSILSPYRNVEVILSEVIDIDRTARSITLVDSMQLSFDYLVLATGCTSSYFGNDSWAESAPSLKSIDDAIEVRSRVLLAFEEAEYMAARTGATPSLHFVIIGGGPTGVELAGALADITQRVLNRDFRHIRTEDSKISLYEGGDTILAAFPPDLQEKGKQQLMSLGVSVHTKTRITEIGARHLVVGDQRIDATVVLWAAGVAPSTLGKKLGLPLDRRGAVEVDSFLNPSGEPNIFVCGDLASATENGKRIPAVAQPAMQMGKHAAIAILADLNGKPRTPFHYFDKGDMATIGTRKAVARIAWPFRAQWSGRPAWLTWLFVHLAFLSGADHQLSVLFTWLYAYLTKTTRSRLIGIPHTGILPRDSDHHPQSKEVS
ncbi:MAG: NAD(P)/FAD-dependent oxidoreductase [Edaphobacter sp.]